MTCFPRKKKVILHQKNLGTWNKPVCYSWLLHGFHISGLCSWYFMAQPGFEKQLKWVPGRTSRRNALTVEPLNGALQANRFGVKRCCERRAVQVTNDLRVGKCHCAYLYNNICVYIYLYINNIHIYIICEIYYSMSLKVDTRGNTASQKGFILGGHCFMCSDSVTAECSGTIPRSKNQL